MELENQIYLADFKCCKLWCRILSLELHWEEKWLIFSKIAWHSFEYLGSFLMTLTYDPGYFRQYSFYLSKLCKFDRFIHISHLNEGEHLNLEAGKKVKKTSLAQSSLLLLGPRSIIKALVCRYFAKERNFITKLWKCWLHT